MRLLSKFVKQNADKLNDAFPRKSLPARYYRKISAAILGKGKGDVKRNLKKAGISYPGAKKKHLTFLAIAVIQMGFHICRGSSDGRAAD